MTDEYLARVPRQLVRVPRGQGQALPWGQGRSQRGQRSPAFVKEEGSFETVSLAWEWHLLGDAKLCAAQHNKHIKQQNF